MELFGKQKSIHLTKITPLDYNFDDEITSGDKIIDIISKVRGKKSIQNVSLKTKVKSLEISADKKLKDAINKSIKDFKACLFIENLIIKDTTNEYKIDSIKLDLNSNN